MYWLSALNKYILYPYSKIYCAYHDTTSKKYEGLGQLMRLIKQSESNQGYEQDSMDEETYHMTIIQREMECYQLHATSQHIFF
jgi:hypothetical protein